MVSQKKNEMLFMSRILFTSWYYIIQLHFHLKLIITVTLENNTNHLF